MPLRREVSWGLRPEERAFTPLWLSAASASLPAPDPAPPQTGLFSTPLLALPAAWGRQNSPHRHDGNVTDGSAATQLWVPSRPQCGEFRR